MVRAMQNQVTMPVYIRASLTTPLTLFHSDSHTRTVLTATSLKACLHFICVLSSLGNGEGEPCGSDSPLPFYSSVPAGSSSGSSLGSSEGFSSFFGATFVRRAN